MLAAREKRTAARQPAMLAATVGGIRSSGGGRARAQPVKRRREQSMRRVWEGQVSQ